MDQVNAEGLPSLEEVNAAMIEQMRLQEEIILRLLDGLGSLDDIDRRWLSIGRTAIEQGFMAVSRAIDPPPRFALRGEES